MANLLELRRAYRIYEVNGLYTTYRQNTQGAGSSSSSFNTSHLMHVRFIRLVYSLQSIYQSQPETASNSSHKAPSSWLTPITHHPSSPITLDHHHSHAESSQTSRSLISLHPTNNIIPLAEKRIPIVQHLAMLITKLLVVDHFAVLRFQRGHA